MIGVGNEIRKLREERGLAQYELAARAGLNPVTITHAETGKGSPSMRTLGKIADALGVDVSDFFPKAQAREGETPGQVQYRNSRTYMRPAAGRSTRTVRNVLDDYAAGELDAEQAEQEIRALIGAE